jgi:hypothetical protein
VHPQRQHSHMFHALLAAYAAHCTVYAAVQLLINQCRALPVEGEAQVLQLCVNSVSTHTCSMHCLLPMLPTAGSMLRFNCKLTNAVPYLLNERSRYSSCASTANSGSEPEMPLLLMLRNWMLGGRAGRLPLRLWPDRSRYRSSLQNPRAWGRVPARHGGVQHVAMVGGKIM